MKTRSGKSTIPKLDRKLKREAASKQKAAQGTKKVKKGKNVENSTTPKRRKTKATPKQTKRARRAANTAKKGKVVAKTPKNAKKRVSKKSTPSIPLPVELTPEVQAVDEEEDIIGTDEDSLQEIGSKAKNSEIGVSDDSSKQASIKPFAANIKMRRRRGNRMNKLIRQQKFKEDETGTGGEDDFWKENKYFGSKKPS